MKAHKITREQYEAAYQLGVRKHLGKVTITEALSELETTGLNKNSAADLVYIATHLINGRRFTRRLSVPAADDYLKWILRDFKTEGLRRALAALERHIDYYESLRNIRLHRDRELLGKYQKLLGQLPKPRAESNFEIEWLARGSKGWADSLPFHWFQNKGVTTNQTHEVRALDRSHVARARCDVTVSDAIADLDYEAHAKFNAAEEMDIGVARIHFSDADRTRIASLEWRSKGETEFRSFQFRSAKLAIADEEEYRRPNGRGTRKTVLMKERPGQEAFRRKLKGAYDHRCCMTDCEVPDALDGAHIDPFISKASDNLQNGLLLRRDVHALFDRHLIAIEPSSKVIHVAPSICTTNGYGFLHEKKVRAPENHTHQPSLPALQRRWRLFKGATK